MVKKQHPSTEACAALDEILQARGGIRGRVVRFENDAMGEKAKVFNGFLMVNRFLFFNFESWGT